MEYKLTIDTLEKERDFYFSKLRDVENMIQPPENVENELATKIKDVLYVVDE